MGHRRCFPNSPDLCGGLVAHFPAGWQFRGHSGVREVIESARKAFPDWTETIEDIIIEGDKAVSRYESTGVHKGFFGVRLRRENASSSTRCRSFGSKGASLRSSGACSRAGKAALNSSFFTSAHFERNPPPGRSEQ